MLKVANRFFTIFGFTLGYGRNIF
uniref:Uncharacterized protein n=1 Tax=Lepeophtheirus salmonis TaxID=72036 RepID=A0A0K2TU22_LEPSM